MTERPIIFSGPMVVAIRAGRKTQTRRVLKDQKPIDLGASTHGTHLSRRPVHDHGKMVGHRQVPVHCPYGEPGDQLWVRESFVAGWPPNTPLGRKALSYKADGDFLMKPAGFPGWKPAIHMPRTACRLRLNVTAVRVERLQAISEDDARAEGVERDRHGWRDYLRRDAIPQATAADSYCTLWESLNAERGFGWATNPWVWAITFKRALT